ncbi:hypothetical protein OC846_001563 [Tilletia horrida]|uniref:VHS domain-containing protein n=1 Tax=Tilletia horrida TaxID=155126 RepID=A0AAN6GTR5_9BASI|nr:hypothetical protein OC846_001563 [Tilletia horrida]KAK0568900.1 hypothetical protein OC861_001507 [Tilletia horrida]
MLKLFRRQQPQQRDPEDDAGLNSAFSALSTSSIPPAAASAAAPDFRQAQQQQPIGISAIDAAPSTSPQDQNPSQNQNHPPFASPPPLPAGESPLVQNSRLEAVRSPAPDSRSKSRNKEKSPASSPAAPKSEAKEQKRGFFSSGGADRAAPKDGPTNYVEGKVTEKIAWLCGSPKSSVDWSYVLNLADSIGTSEPAAKEAARAIRKEFKYGEAQAQRRAVRVWAILMMNASERFRAQVATKRFLEVVESVATNSKTDPAVVDKMLNVLAVLAYHGEPMDPNSEDFNPPIQRSRSPLAIPPHNTTTGNAWEEPGSGELINGGDANLRPPSASRGDSDQSRESGARGRRKKDYSHKIISLEEDMRKLHEECDIGRTNADVLIDTLTSFGLSSPLLEEFAHKVQLSHMFLAGQIDWASAQANRSRDYMDEQMALAMALSAENNGAAFSPPAQEETREEVLLADILSANERLMEAQQMLDDARKPSALPPLPPEFMAAPLPSSAAASSSATPAPPAIQPSAVTPVMNTIEIADESVPTPTSIHTPTMPSEKALGKRRAVSERGDAFDPAQTLGTQAPVHVPVKLHEVLEQEDDDDDNEGGDRQRI